MSGYKYESGVGQRVESTMAIKLLGLVCLVGAALAGPLQRGVENQCSTSCPSSSDEKFQYLTGNRYNYEYKGIDYVSVAGKRKEMKSQITANVEIQVLDQCEMELRVSNFRYQGEQPFSPDIETRLSTPLRFSWVDGKIEAICSSSDESQESENVKRGILSAIINTMPDLRSSSRHQEVDSLGSCETTYTVTRKFSDSVIIKKEKSLKSCDNRHSGITAFPYNPYQSHQSKIQGLPIFTHEELRCEQEIEKQVIKRAICKASAQIQPLSKYDSLVQFEGEVQLQLLSVQQSSFPISQISSLQSSNMDKKSIRYNYDQQQDVESKEREATKILTEICQQADGLVQPAINKLYMRLITVLKGLSVESVQGLYESLKSQKLCQSQKTLDIFLDALPMVGTEGTVKLMVELLTTKQVSGLKAKLWPASFALIPNPNAETISVVLPLVDGEDKSRPLLLGLSAMIHKICQNGDCSQVESINHAVSVLQQGLGQRCSSDNDQEVISILKAFGNMGYHGQAEETILACARSSEKSVPVRIAAIEAFRRCAKEFPTSLTELYSSQSENFEIRIAALVTLVSCPDPSVSDAIQKVLESDQDEQVVAFTLSLVKNLQETSSPLKQSIKQSLQHIKTDRNVSYFENSKNIELSAFNVPTNLGASLESNIIHAQGSIIPRSFSSRIDIDLFGKSVNIFEFGTRAEGLEKTVRKLFEMEESTQQKRSWLSLTSRRNEDKQEISFYARTFGTEFFDLTVSDFTGVSNMMQFADVLKKVSQERKADFAHSFLFLNTKVIVPSLTGRSYVFGMTGSATVGLTANGKFDLVNIASSPRNCDLGGHIQPSANVEITTTLGVHSEKSRPNVKIVTSFHTEADVGAKLRVQNSHVAEARLDMPSDKVQFLKVSTELFEVDANDNETPIIEEMEKKIDHCISSLEKPLGLQFCAKLETPRPFVSRNFPYARGLGNFEIAIKKVDRSMSGYVISFEMPKHKSDRMSYRFTMDTPGSSINRKFQGHLGLEKTASGEREFKLDAQSPFKNIFASGSYTWRSDLVKGALNVMTDNSRRYSVNAAVEMSKTKSEMTLKPTLQWALPTSEPVSVSGSIIYSNRRKQQIMVDLRSNKAGEKPYVFTGNFMKDGSIGLRKEDQWKMSADLFTKSPFITTKVHSTVDKKSGQSHSLETGFSVDYETQRLRKQSIKLFSKVQQSSSKISASSQFETTQFPKCNLLLSWDMQGNLKESLKNDITVNYGENPERSYVQISQTFLANGQNSLSEGKISLQAPQFSIDSELKVAVNLRMRETNTFHVESDLRYKGQRHVKCLVQLKQLSKTPLKMAVKAQLEYPGRKLVYKDEIQETSANVYQGHSIFQWHQRRQASLRYKYKRLSDDSTFHHEMESTFNAPFMTSQTVNQASLKATKENIEIHAQLQSSRKSSYKLDAQLHRRGKSRVFVSAPVVEGEMEVINESKQKSGIINVLLKKREPQRLIASAAIDLSNRRSLQTEVIWNADASPAQKVSLAAKVEADYKSPQKFYSASSQIQVLDIVKVDTSCKCEKTHQITVQSRIDASGRNFETFSIETRSEMNRESIHSAISYKKEHREKAVVELSGKYAKQSKGSEVQGTVLIKSPDHSFEDKELFIRHSFDRTHSSMNFQTTARFDNAPGRKHEVAVEYSNEAKMSRKLRVSVETPYQRFIKQEISLSHRREQDRNTVNAVIQYSRKEIALSSVLTKTSQRRSIECSLKTPFRMAERATVFAVFENQKAQKQIESHFELNGQKKFEYIASYVSGSGRQKIQSSAKLFMKSELAMNLKAEKDKNSINHEFSATKDSSPLLSYKISHRFSGEEFICQIEALSGENKFVDVKLTKEVKGSIRYTLKVNKPFTPISLVIQSMKGDENSCNVMVSACKESAEKLCYGFKSYYKRESDAVRSTKQRKIILDFEKTAEQRAPELLCSVSYLSSQQDRTVKSSFLFKAKQKQYGYVLTMKQRSNEDRPHELDISFVMPARTARCSLTAIHNSRSSAFELSMIPSTSTPSHKISLEAKRSGSFKDNELSGQFKFSHPALQKPISAKYSVSKEQSRLMTSGKLEIDYSKKPEDKLIMELSSQSPRGQPEKKTFQCRLYTQGKDLDFTLRTSVHQTVYKDSYTCDWSWQSRQEKKSGKLSFELSDKRSGRPQSAKIEFTCPKSQYAVIGHTEWVASSMPSMAVLKLLSSSRVVGEILYELSDSCATVEIKSSAPLLTNRICMNKSEQDKLTLLRVESTCQDVKCLELSLDLDPSQSHIANVGITWEKKQFVQMLDTVKNVRPSFQCQQCSEIKEEIKQKAKLIYSPLKEQVLKPIVDHTLEEIRQIFQQELNEMKQLQKLLENLCQKFPKLPTQDEVRQYLEKLLQWLKEDAMKYLEKYTQEWFYDLVKSILEAATKYFHDFCQRGTFCHKLKQTYQRRGLQHVQRLLQSEFHQRIEKLQRVKIQKMTSVRSWISETWGKVKSWVEKYNESVLSVIEWIKNSSLFEKLAEKVKLAKERLNKKSMECFEKLMEYVDDVMDHARNNEDFKALFSFFLKAKSEIVGFFQKFNLKEIMEPMSNTILQKLPQMWLSEKIHFTNFDVHSGKIQLQLHHPLNQSKIQMMKNAFDLMKDKIQSLQK